VQFIDWWSAAPAAASTRVKLELSTTGNAGPWLPIADSLRNAGRYQWLVPDSVISGDCYVRYTVSGPGGSAEGITAHAFVIGDTVLGVAESPKPQAVSYKLGVTVIRRVLNLQSAICNLKSEIVLLDAAGRKVANLHPGANDVSRLPPGVYFVHSTTDNRQAEMTKLVVTR